MNSFGSLFRVSIYGESHGSSVGILIDGCPAGIELEESDFLEDLKKRQGGNLIGTTSRKELDIPKIHSGIYKSKSTGSPILIDFENSNIKSEDYNSFADIPRPSHADFVAMKKFNNFNDPRGSGHFSGRLTTGIVAAGVVAKKVLKAIEIRIEIKSSILEIGGFSNIEEGIKFAIDQNDSIGGIVECTVSNIPIGLGEPFFDSVESIISHGIFSIPGIKAIEFGSGFACSKMLGSHHNDSIISDSGKTKTNNSGGIVGGITNENDIIFRIAVKPTASTPKEQSSLNVKTGMVESFSVKGRHDLCIALRMPVIIEAMTAICLADLILKSKKYEN